jgi:hypothetical protein
VSQLKKSLSAAASTAVLAGSLLLGAGPAQAVENVNQERLSWATTDEVVATCANGDQIGLGFDLVRNRHIRYDDAGELVHEVRNVRYTGIFENLTTHERYTFNGTRIITIDIPSDTFTSVGNYRVVTKPGEGSVFRAAGRVVSSWFEETEPTFTSGPKFDEWSDGGASVTCGLFSLEG